VPNKGLYGFPSKGRRVYDPLCPPENPSALNEEFDIELSGSGAPPGFASAGPQTPTWEIRNGKLRLSSPAVGANFNPSALEKDLPSGAFTVATFAMIQNFNPYGFVGLHLRNTSTGAKLAFALAVNPGAPGNIYLAYDKFSSFTVRTADSSQFIYDRSVGFLRLRSNGTTLVAEFSYDGDTWITRASENLSTHFGGNLPDRFGIQIDSYSATEQGRGSFDFLRYFPADNADIGRMITREV
jgi:hypothetical protein